MHLYSEIQSLFPNILHSARTVQKLWLALCTIEYPLEGSRWCSSLCKPTPAGDAVNENHRNVRRYSPRWAYLDLTHWVSWVPSVKNKTEKPSLSFRPWAMNTCSESLPVQADPNWQPVLLLSVFNQPGPHLHAFPQITCKRLVISSTSKSALYLSLMAQITT